MASLHPLSQSANLRFQVSRKRKHSQANQQSPSMLFTAQQQSSQQNSPAALRSTANHRKIFQNDPAALSAPGYQHSLEKDGTQKSPHHNPAKQQKTTKHLMMRCTKIDTIKRAGIDEHSTTTLGQQQQNENLLRQSVQSKDDDLQKLYRRSIKGSSNQTDEDKRTAAAAATASQQKVDHSQRISSRRKSQPGNSATKIEEGDGQLSQPNNQRKAKLKIQFDSNENLISTLQPIRRETDVHALTNDKRAESSFMFQPSGQQSLIMKSAVYSPRPSDQPQDDTIESYHLQQRIDASRDYHEANVSGFRADKFTGQTRSQMRLQQTEGLRKQPLSRSPKNSEKSAKNARWRKFQINQDLPQMTSREPSMKYLTEDERDQQFKLLRKEAEQRKQLMINKLLFLTEQKIARELRVRRSSSMEDKAEARRQSRIETDLELGEGDLQQSILLLDKRHRELSDTQTRGGSVMSTAQIKQEERRMKWRKDTQERDVVANYQSRYNSCDISNRNKIAENTNGMGPFYQKYIKQMAQKFVKDRVRRLKETFEAVQSGQLDKRLLDHSLTGGKFMRENSTVAWNSIASTINQLQQSDSILQPMATDTYGSIGDSSDFNKSTQLWQDQIAAEGRKSKLAPFEQKHHTQASILRAATNMGSPLMRLSGIQLKYRLGHGDRTLDQVLYVGENQQATGSLQTRRSENSVDGPRGSVGFDRGNSADTVEDPLMQSSSAELEVERKGKDQPNLRTSINLPETERGRKQHQSVQKNDNSPRNQDDQRGLALEQRNHSSNTVDETLQMAHQSEQIMKPINPQISVTGTRGHQGRGTSMEAPDTAISKQQKSLISADPLNMSLFSTVRKPRDPSLNLPISAAQQQQQAANQDIGQDLLGVPTGVTSSNFETPHTRAKSLARKAQKKRWNYHQVVKDKVAGKEFKMNSHRNTLSKHVWRGPSMQSESVQQLIDETIKHLYSDMALPQKKEIGYLKQKQQRLMPVDLAVLKQKAFQQFDLIRDAEKDIERTIKTKQHITYGKDAPTPRGQRRFTYSNMSSKLKPEEAKKFHDDPMQASYQEFTHNESSVISNSYSNAQPDGQTTNLSFLKMKQKRDERKMCQSCLDPRAHKSGAVADSSASTMMFRSTKRTLQSDEDRFAAHMQSGSYHTRLNCNLKITKDFQLAAGRTRRGYNLVTEPNSPNIIETEEEEEVNIQDHLETDSGVPRPCTFEEEVLEIARRIKNEETPEVSCQSSRREHMVARDLEQRTQGGLMIVSSKDGLKDDIVFASLLNSQHPSRDMIAPRIPQKTPASSIQRVPSNLYKIDQNASVLEPEMFRKGQMASLDTNGPSLTRASNSNVFNTGGNKVYKNATVEQAKQIIEGGQKTSFSEKKSWVQIKPQSITPPIQQTNEASKDLIDEKLLDRRPYMQFGKDGIQAEYQAKPSTSIEPAIYSSMLEVQGRGQTKQSFIAMTKSSQMSSSLHGFQQPKYSKIKDKRQMTIVRGDSDVHKRKAQLQGCSSKDLTHLNQFDSQEASPRQPEQATLPAVVKNQSQQNQLRLKNAIFTGPGENLKIQASFKRGSESPPVKGRFKITQKLTPAQAEIQSQFSTLNHPLMTSTLPLDHSYMVYQPAESLGENSSLGDVATLAKSSIMSSAMSTGNHKKRAAMHKNYITSLALRQNKAKVRLDDTFTSGGHQENPVLPKRHSQQIGAASRWKSPFQAHIERNQAQKQMLKFIVNNQPSEVVHKMTEDKRSNSKEGHDYQINVLNMKPSQAKMQPPPSVVHWMESAPSIGRANSLNPLERDSMPHLRGDENSTALLLGKFAQNYTQSLVDRSLPMNHGSLKKKNSADQTEENPIVNDYGQRNRTAEQMIGRRAPGIRHDICTPGTELRLDATFHRNSAEQTLIQHSSSYENFVGVKVNLNRDVTLNVSDQLLENDSKQQSLQNRASTQQFAMTTMQSMDLKGHRVSDYYQIGAIKVQQNDSSQLEESHRDDDGLNFVGKRIRTLQGDRANSGQSIQRSQELSMGSVRKLLSSEPTVDVLVDAKSLNEQSIEKPEMGAMTKSAAEAFSHNKDY